MSLVQLAHTFRQKQDYKEAARLYQLAAQEGDSNGEAEAWLSFLYLKDLKDLKELPGLSNDAEAFRISKIGVQKGHPLAFSILAYCYYVGRGTQRDVKEAIKLYKEGAERGCSNAQFRLAYCFKNGECVQQDFKEAFRLF